MQIFTYFNKKSYIFFIFILLNSFINISGQKINISNLPPYVHPPILSPIPDGVKQEVPKVLGNQKYAALGIVDVTAAPFYADPTGKRDSTKALQAAIDFARDNQMVCFFPLGTYTISDTLICRHGIFIRSHRGAVYPHEYMPCFLLGSRLGEGSSSFKRPKIVLAPNSKGFNNPDKKKFLIDYIIFNIENIHDINSIDTSPSSYSKMYNYIINAAFKNIDIEIGKGNSGAVGIRFNAAEGSVIQDVQIDATYGYTGIDGAAGNGANWANIIVIGGEIGLDMREYSVPTPTMVGITLIGQRKAAIMSKVRGSLTIVGLKIVSKINGPLIIAEKRNNNAFDGTMNIIDSEIIFENQSSSLKKNIAIASPERSIYLKNLYVKNADEVVQGYCNGIKKNWIRVKEFAIGVDLNWKEKILSYIYINGKKKGKIFSEIENNSKPSVDLVTKHIAWDSSFPHFEMKNIANVKDSPYNAKGDSYTDDTDAIQKAIDENEYVFLPKGYYRITKTIKLKSNTKLFGIAQHLSVIMVRDPEGYFGDIKSPHPMIETVNDADAKTILAYCYIAVPEEAKLSFKGDINPVYAIKWMAGKNSIYRSVFINKMRVYGFLWRNDIKNLTHHYPHVVITGNGGGKWYNFYVEAGYQKHDNNYRLLLINNIKEPLFFYNTEPQLGTGLAMVEAVNSKNFTFFGCKTEGTRTFMYFKNCEAFSIIGHGGVGNADKGGAIYRIENCKNFIITNISDQMNWGKDRKYDPEYDSITTHLNYKKFFPISERFFGRKIIIPSNERPVIYKRK